MIDILESMGQKQVALLVLLDLSAAFDNFNHTILSKTMKQEFGIQNAAPTWLASYLINRSQKVLISDSLSDSVSLKFGVPQGSCLGPVLFTAYLSTLFRVISNHMITSYGYANDMQLLKVIKLWLVHESDDMCIDRCVHDIQAWMSTYRLKLNENKTEVMLFGTKQQLAKITSTHIGDNQIKIVDHVRNLGGWLDSNLSILV